MKLVLNFFYVVFFISRFIIIVKEVDKDISIVWTTETIPSVSFINDFCNLVYIKCHWIFIVRHIICILRWPYLITNNRDFPITPVLCSYLYRCILVSRCIKWLLCDKALAPLFASDLFSCAIEITNTTKMFRSFRINLC